MTWFDLQSDGKPSGTSSRGKRMFNVCSTVLSDPAALTLSPPLTEPIRVKGQWGHLPPLNAFEPGRQEEGVRRAI